MEGVKIDKQIWKRDFAIVFMGQAISLIGSSAVQFALIWWLASESSSSLVMSIANLVAFLPQFILGPFIGVWIDRMKRKPIIICSDLFVGAAALITSLAFMVWHPTYIFIYIVLGLRSIGNMFHQPAMQAIIPLLVPSEKLVKANGWGQFIQAGAYIIGPMLGATMYTYLPLWLVLLTDTIGAIFASISVAIINIPDLFRENKEDSHFFREMKEGIRVLFQDKILLIITLMSSFAMIFYSPLNSYYPLMSTIHFNATAVQAGWVEVLYAIGLMLTSFLFGYFGKGKNKVITIHSGAWLMGMAALLCGLLPSEIHWFWLFIFLYCLMGVGYNLYNIPYIAYMQQNVPPEKMGRTFTVIRGVFSSTTPLGLIIAGPISENYGVTFWYIIAGIVICILTIISFLLIKLFIVIHD